MASPSTASTMPVMRLSAAGSARLANTADTLAPTKVATTHRISANGSGRPPMTKWDTAPVKAVNDMIKTLVPTAVLSS